MVYKKDKQKKPLSIKEIIGIPQSELKDMKFIFDKRFEQRDKFFTIKTKQLVGENENEVMITFVDAS